MALLKIHQMNLGGKTMGMDEKTARNIVRLIKEVIDAIQESKNKQAEKCLSEHGELLDILRLAADSPGMIWTADEKLIALASDVRELSRNDPGYRVASETLNMLAGEVGYEVLMQNT